MIGREVLVALAIGALAGTAWAAEKVHVPGSRVTYDETIQRTIGEKKITLVLTGTALREKFWLNLYTIGSYVEPGAKVKTAEELAAADVAKQIDLVLEKTVPGKIVADSIKKAVLANYSPEQFAGELEEMCAYLAARRLRRGSHVWITHVPGVGVTCRTSGRKERTIRNLAFAKAVWDVCFGEKNIGTAIKRGLCSRL